MGLMGWMGVRTGAGPSGQAAGRAAWQKGWGGDSRQSTADNRRATVWLGGGERRSFWGGGAVFC